MALQSKDKLNERKENLKNVYLNLFGDFPAKTPLNPLITGTIQCEDYQSIPGKFQLLILWMLQEIRKGETSSFTFNPVYCSL